RSFDDLFCDYPRSDAARCSALREAIPLEADCKLSDTFEDFERDKKTGDFSNVEAACGGIHRAEYRTVSPKETEPYRAMADSYVLGDRMFASTGNQTFESHQYAIAAQSGADVD